MRTGQEWGIKLTLLCSLSGYSRQAYYKHGPLKACSALPDELIISRVISYRKVQKRTGTRKLHLLLGPFRSKHGMHIGRDRLFDLLRSHGLLIGKSRPRKPVTTFSRHNFRKHPDLFKGLTPLAANGVWVSDITYMELCRGEGYLSLVTDAYSRKVVGHYLSDRLDASGTVKALQMAIAGCKDTGGLIHHSDRGVQYCCNAYVAVLEQHQISISMTQTGDPRDNAIAERVNGILKNELLEQVYPDLVTAREAVAEAINTYNYLRPHSSLEMLTPAIAHGRYGELRRCWGGHYNPRLGKEVLTRT